uniref:PDZ domain-containing protein n=1 Tax=Oryzias latipes TaxID=8090 RepID=A0A3P9H055_ORYLA
MDSEADTELTLTDTDTESVPSLLCFRTLFGFLPHRVEVWPEEGESLGLSIVGGRHVIKRLKNGEELKGIFIKQVIPGSPALDGRLMQGDQILSVNGEDTRHTSQEAAAAILKQSVSWPTGISISLVPVACKYV